MSQLGLSLGKVGSGIIGQWSWFLGILLLEFINTFTIGMKFNRFPFRHIISNPLDPVLKLVAVYTGVQDCFDTVFIFAISLNCR
jgi:hypothetical protein